MSLPIYRLRRWLIVIALLFTVVVAGMYFYARLRQLNLLKGLPGKMGYDIKQTASGFQFSKSDGGRTIFTIQAKDVKEFKLNGHAELHTVSITLYGRDSSRFDRIYGDDFTYDPKSGNVTARGEVQIDLDPNPAGFASPDQAVPNELRNPIHLKTRDLIFNRDTGNAQTDARVDFSTSQASGWAVGVQYAGKSNTLTLDSQIHVQSAGADASKLFATHGKFTSDPRQLVLDQPRLERSSGTLRADEATFFLAQDNSVQRVLAVGNVNADEAADAKANQTKRSKRAHKRVENNSEQVSSGESASAQASVEPVSAGSAPVESASGGTPTGEPAASPTTHARADQADLILTGSRNQLRTATLTGHVQVDRVGSEAMQGTASRAVIDFGRENQVKKVHATEGVRLTQHAVSGTKPAKDTIGTPGPTSVTSSQPQDFELTAPTVDFFMADGGALDRAATSGAPQITIFPAQNPGAAPVSLEQRTVITAARFDAKFTPTVDGQSRLTSFHGAPAAKIVSIAPGQPNRVSTSQTLDAAFLPEGGIESITQQGSVAYSDGLPPDKRTQAWAERAHYTPADQILVLTGNPRVVEASIATSARTIRMNRATGEAFAEGDVKSTYNELQEQPNGALLASSSPIHVTAHSMTAHQSSAVALYSGNARLWQDANVIEAPSIQFDRDRRFVVAQGTAAQPVSTVLVQAEKAQAEKDRAEKAQAEKDQAEKAQAEKVQAGKAPPGAEQKTKPPGKSEKSAQSQPVVITSVLLTYADAERRAHYEGGVVAKGVNFTASAKTLDAFLLPRIEPSQASDNKPVVEQISAVGPGRLDHMVAQGNVVVQQPNRRANGQTLVYTAADDKFVLTGGPPSIFDAERGRITGVSLTFFEHDDRVLVEGEASTPVVTRTRVAR